MPPVLVKYQWAFLAPNEWDISLINLIFLVFVGEFTLVVLAKWEEETRYLHNCGHKGGAHPGGTHIFGRTGMCRPNGSLFYKKSLNMGPVFYQKILKHGSTFLTEPKFLGFHMAKTLKIAKFLENGPIFQEKSLKMGTLFCHNHP